MSERNSVHDTNSICHPRRPTLPGWDVLLVVLLTLSILMIAGFAESGLGGRFADVARHPFLGAIVPEAGVAAMGQIGPRPAEPIGLLLYAITIALTILYGLIDLALRDRWQWRLKWIVLGGILLTALYLPTVKLMLLDTQGPRGSYSHDGGVLQTEATIDFLLQGKNPYREDYTATPLATWGHPDFRTALYHYPYLPWTFLFSAPFYLLGNALGFYDQRIVYLLLFTVALLLLPRLATTPRHRLALVALIGLNPLMALDIMFGQNDVFVLSWLIFALVAWRHWQTTLRPAMESAQNGAALMEQSGQRARLIAMLCFGAACASKPTAWFFAPFFALLLLAGDDRFQAHAARGALGVLGQLGTMLRRAWPALMVFLLCLLPYLLWDPFALYDDVWRWSNGQGETGYQIWGWGASNFVLALGLVSDRFGQWPFWQLELLLALPILLWFLYRQIHANTLAAACWHYGFFLLIFFYGSRFLNENYLAFILAFLVLGIFTEIQDAEGVER